MQASASKHPLQSFATALWPELHTGPRALAEAIYARGATSARTVALLRDAILILTFALVIAGSAQLAVKLPFTPVPITGQTCAVLLTGAALGMRRGFLAASAYIGMGLAGAPFFASGKSGYFWEFTSGGYLVSYPFAAAAVGWLTERGWNRGLWLVTALLIGNVIIYAFGLAWLGGFIASNAFRPLGLAPWYAVIPGSDVLQKTLIGGLYPFIPGDLAKVAIAAGIVPSAWGFVRALESPSEPLRRAARTISTWLLPLAVVALWTWALLWSIHVKF